MASALWRSAIYCLAAAVVCSNVSAAEVSYFRDIWPVIQRQCQGCHQPSIKSSNLDLTSYAGFQAGGRRGPAKEIAAQISDRRK